MRLRISVLARGGKLAAPALLMLTGACDRRAPPGRDPAPAVSTSGSARPSPAAVLLDTQVRHEVAAIVRGVQEIAPRPTPPQTLAFGRDGLGILGEKEVLLVNVRDGRVTTRWSEEEPRRIVALQDGSLLVLAQQRGAWLELGAKLPRPLARVSSFASTTVLPDRVHVDRFWLSPGFGNSLFGYDLAESSSGKLLQIARTEETPDYSGGALASLRDGSFVYFAADQVRRFQRGSAVRALGVRAQSPWRVLTTRRLDQVWVIERGGRALLAELGPRSAPLRALELGGTPFDAAAEQQGFAIVGVAKPRDRDWTLRVFDDAGRQLMDVPLDREPDPASNADRNELAARSRSVVMSPFEPLVAVGGPDRVCVWQIPQSAPSFCLRPASLGEGADAQPASSVPGRR
jgi:hypothetical protein